MNFDFGRKRHYRRRTYSFIDEVLRKKIHKNDRIIMYLETSQALETAFLLEQKQYRPNQLIPVNANPAHIAVVNRIFKNVHGIGLDIADAIKKASQQGRAPNVVNLDFCSCISVNLEKTIKNVSKALVCINELVVAYNVLNGREHPKALKRATKDALKTVFECGPDCECSHIDCEYSDCDCVYLEECSQQEQNEWARLEYINNLLTSKWNDRITITTGFRDKYKSDSGQTFVFGAAYFDKSHYLTKEFLESRRLTKLANRCRP